MDNDIINSYKEFKNVGKTYSKSKRKKTKKQFNWDKFFQKYFNVKYIFEIIGLIIIVCLIIWAIFTQKRSKYLFKGLDGIEYGLNIKTKKNLNKSEEYCRDILQSIYGEEFKTCRPDFLKNPATGRNLELDCYNERLKIALEYDGIQHAEYNPHFHKNGIADFKYQIARDDFKTKKCKANGIFLIRVPHYIVKEDLRKYIIDKLQSANKMPV